MDATTLHSLEPDPERAREIAERGLILRTTVGSVVHGLSNPGTDDRDELGVCVEPPEYLLGYLDAQRRGLVGERHATRTRELSREHGYDTKYAMPALRIGYQGIELLVSGRITLPMADSERRALRDVRAGRVPLVDVLDHIDRVAAQLDAVCATRGLPERSDVDAVDRFVVRAYRHVWDMA